MTMSTCLDDIVLPLAKYVKDVLSTPILLHEVPRKALSSLTPLMSGGGSSSKDCSRVDLTDILSVLKDALDVHLPFAWMAFASDTASAFAQTGLFKEKTDEA